MCVRSNFRRPASQALRGRCLTISFLHLWELGRLPVLVEIGQAIETILKHATQGGFDLILLGSVSSSMSLPKLVPGTAYGVLCGAPCPVLILKQAADTPAPRGLQFMRR